MTTLSTFTESNTKIAFKIFQGMNSKLNFREQRIAFIKQGLTNELNDCRGLNREQVRKSIANRIAMVDLLNSAGLPLDDIEYTSHENITEEELDSYRNFKLIKVGLYRPTGLRRACA